MNTIEELSRRLHQRYRYDLKDPDNWNMSTWTKRGLEGTVDKNFRIWDYREYYSIHGLPVMVNDDLPFGVVYLRKGTENLEVIKLDVAQR